MPWVCKGLCHLNDAEDFEVERIEAREDSIMHRFRPDDENLEDMDPDCDPKVYVGEESTWEEPTCSVCEKIVTFEKPGTDMVKKAMTEGGDAEKTVMQEALDSAIHDIKGQEAADINNEGWEAQVEALPSNVVSKIDQEFREYIYGHKDMDKRRPPDAG